METGVSLERALRIVLDHAVRVGAEELPAREARGRVLAADVSAPMDQPPWPRSPLDGYALRAADSAGASRETPVTLTVVDTVFAGGVSTATVGPGQAVRLTTGAPIPAGCDCVIRQEDTDGGREKAALYKALRPWENYCFAGEDFHAGETLLPAGTRLNAAALGILASAGLLGPDSRLSVFRRVRCALLCTGDELAPGDVRPLPPGKIYSANEALLSARLTELGAALTTVRGCFGDDAAALAAALAEAAEESDLILTTGGVSVGEKDILHQALPLLGAETLLWRVALKPGSPLMFSVYRGVPILSLSGNPFAAAATFELLGRPLLAALAGAEDLLPQTVSGVLETPFPKSSPGRRFVRGVFRSGAVTLPAGHSSGQLRSAAGTNCLVEIPAGSGPLPAGTDVTVHLL